MLKDNNAKEITKKLPKIEPIHKGEITYSIYKAVKHLKEKPLPFGSTASRITK